MSTDPVALAQQLVRIDTAGRGELAAARAIEGILTQAGARVELVHLAPGRASLVAFAGEAQVFEDGAVRAPLVLSGHLDTVPPATEGWSCDPLGGEVADGCVTGCGAADMKSGVAALVVAVERFLASGGPAQAVTAPGAPDAPGAPAIVLVLSAAEETGCLGAQQVADAGLVPTGGPLLVAEPTANRIALGHKGAQWLEYVARGVSAHGSRPELGKSALAPLARIAVKLAEHGVPVADGDARAFDEVTVNIGSIQAGTQVNLVPDSGTLTVDLRPVPGTDPVALARAMAGLIAEGEDVTLRPLLDHAPVYSPADGTFVALVEHSLREVTGQAERIEPLTYFTDASVLTTALGSPEVVIVGPGEPTAAHSADERCSVNRITEACAVYERIIAGWAGP